MTARLTTTALRSLAATCAAACIAAPSFAAAPMAKTPAPGYFRMMLGDVEVTPLSDGTVDLPVDKLLTQKAEKTTAALAKAHLKAPLETSDNAFLVNTGSKLILIDTGAGVLFGPTLGKLLPNMKAAGYTPEQVDEVYLTHMHSDHLGGLLAPSKEMAFPNAVVRASKTEADHWLSQANMDKAPGDGKDTFRNAMAALAPYVKAGKFKTFEGDAQVSPGIRAQGGHGHTPGHTTFVVESRGRKMVFIGDLIHVASVQFENPAVAIGFDGDQKAAAAARKKLFDAAAKDGSIIGGAHLQFPGLGHLRSEGKGYRFIPVNYTQMR
ncbi:MAG: fold metallo-hydrolase [Massilia sp.]|jgi:glyoxylase-like metal-dependent hydrolase (beta-lactamase superfamily II)|nr:fold metallo-hydrolase [Massilia sp.]MDB5793255.1 fold metallo-hydrolase [Massilia sp.]